MMEGAGTDETSLHAPSISQVKVFFYSTFKTTRSRTYCTDKTMGESTVNIKLRTIKADAIKPKVKKKKIR